MLPRKTKILFFQKTACKIEENGPGKIRHFSKNNSGSEELSKHLTAFLGCLCMVDIR